MLKAKDIVAKKDTFLRNKLKMYDALKIHIRHLNGPKFQRLL